MWQVVMKAIILESSALVGGTSRKEVMMSLLFALFLIVMVLTLSNKERLSFVAFGTALALSTVWFVHHASSTLTIQL